MSLRTPSLPRPNRPLVREWGLVTATLVGLFLWQRLMRAVTRPLSNALGAFAPSAEFVLVGVVTGGLLVAGVALLVGGYALVRGIDTGLALPTRADRPLLGLAGAVPLVLVGVTGVVGTLTGAPYGSHTLTYYGPDPPILPLVTVVGLGIAVGVPCLALVSQVLVQGSLERALDGRSAVVPTTLVSGFVLTSGAGGLTTVPDRGRLAGAVVLLALLALAVYADGRVSGEWLRRLAYAPVLAFVAVAVVSGVAEIESLAGGLFALTHLAVLGVAAYTYDRSDSLVVPAFAYLCLSLANEAVVVFEAGATPPF